MDEPAFSNLIDCVGELVDKIRLKYPSLKQWQAYVAASALVGNLSDCIDKPESEKYLTNAILQLIEMPDIQCPMTND